MRRVLLVTAREYRRILGLPAFWIISFLIPLIVAAAPLAQNLFGRSQTVGYVLVDRSGRYAAQINQHVDLDYQRQVLINLLVYAREWRDGSSAAASEGGLQTEQSSSDAAVENFVAAGGAPAILRLLKPKLLPSAAPFRAPSRSFVDLPLPDGVATDSADRFGASIGPHFEQTSTTPAGKAALGVAIYIPSNVDSGGQVRVWTNGPAGAALIQELRLELTQALQLNALRGSGVDPHSAAQIKSLSAPLSIAPPQTSAAGGEAVIHSALPLVLAELLLISMVITGSMMLQGLVEERSNKLLEAVLACVNERELLIDKLLGISAIGLSIVGVWGGAIIGIIHAEPSSPLGFLLPALASLSQTPWVAAAMISRRLLKTAALRTHGENVFTTACASCHEPAIGRAPSHEQLASFTPERIVEALTSGVMKPMVANLSEDDIRAVATYLTGRQPVGSSAMAADPPPCPKPVAFSMDGGGWNGWSTDPRNWRFQPDPGLAPSDIPRLKVKWAFSYDGGKYGQPTIVGGRLFLTSMSGAVYSLDAKTGCMFWRFTRSTPARTTISVGPAPGVAPSGYAAYFGDLSAIVYAVDAASGALLWKTRVDPHPRSVLTGAPPLFKDQLYVPVSSWEEGVASVAHYSCCTFRGSVVALDTATGKIVWKTFAIEQPAAPSRKNSTGTQMYGPAGAAVWSAPMIDTGRNRLYFATGNSYTDVMEGRSDAVIAVDLTSGEVVWRHQLTRGDNSLSGCGPGRQLVNCPSTLGHDYDFGASPILLTLPTGKDILLAGQKSGPVFGINPDTGEVLWRTQVGIGGFLGGIEWGMASDGSRLYVANTDVLAAETGRPGLFALDPATGKDLWYTPSPHAGATGPAGCPASTRSQRHRRRFPALSFPAQLTATSEPTRLLTVAYSGTSTRPPQVTGRSRRQRSGRRTDRRELRDDRRRNVIHDVWLPRKSGRALQ